MNVYINCRITPYSALLHYIRHPKACCFPAVQPAQGNISKVILVMRHFHAMFLKLFMHTHRRPLVTFMQAVVPFGFTMLVLLIREDDVSELTPLQLDLSHFRDNVVAYGFKYFSCPKCKLLMDAYSSQFQDIKHVQLEDISGRWRVNEYLLAVGKNNTAELVHHRLVAAQFDVSEDGDVACVALFNYEAYHTAAISLNLVDNALLRYLVGPEYSIRTTNNHRHHKLGEIGGVLEFYDVHLAEHSEHKSIIFCLSVTFPVIMTFYVMFVIEERFTGSKRDQAICGVHYATYWIANILYDFAHCLVPIASSYALFNIRKTGLFESDNVLSSALLLIMYAWSMLPMVYLTSLFFSSCATAVVWLTVYNLATG